jgi:hypothetical protein
MLRLVSPVIRPNGSEGLDAFAADVNITAERTHLVVIDCSELDALSVPAIRILESLSRRATVELINASPIVCLLATTFGLAVEPRHQGADLGAVESDLSSTGDEDLLDELRDLAAARHRVNERIELCQGATPRELRQLHRIAKRVDTVVAALRRRRPLGPVLAQ